MKCKLKDIAEINPKLSLKKGQLAKKIAMDQLRPFCRDIPGYTVEPFSGGTKFCNGDTIMARITPCLENGKTAKVTILDEGEVGFGSTEYIVFRAKNGISDEDYLYYLICSPLIRDAAIKSMVGSSGRQRVQTTVVENIEIDLPSIEKQKRIGALLRAFDDKIELNNKINANLEQQAQALFKAWFVDFEPFGGKMPEDWRVSSLTDIAHYLNGLAMQKYRPQGEEGSVPVLKIKELRQGHCDAASDRCSAKIPSEYIIHDGDVIFSWSGSLLVDFWCGGKCGLNQHLFKVTSSHYDTWFFYSWTKYHLARFIAIAADKATTMGHIKRDALEDAKVLIPSEWDYQMLGNILAPMYRKIVCNRIENRKLARLRDMLLQRLMSGEIDVSDISFPKL